MKNIFLFFLSFFFIACSSESEEEMFKSLGKINQEHANSLSLEETFDVVEEEKVPLNYYQIAREKHPKKERLPFDIVLHNSDEIFDYTILNFEKILSTTKNWFLCKYLHEEGEISEEFYITFDYNGNQLDAILAVAFAEDLNGSVSFENDSVFIAKQRIDDAELNDDGDLLIHSTSEEETRYKITSDGKFNVLEPSI